MSDLEQLLPHRLHVLADDLTPHADPIRQADAARTRHRHQRRTRIGLTAVAVAVIAVSVGVPTAMQTLSAPSPRSVATPGGPSSTSAQTQTAVEAQEQAQALARVAAASAAAESAAAAASPGPYAMPIDPAAQAVIEAEEAKGAAQLTDALVALHAPVRIGTPPAAAPCPDAGTLLSSALGTHLAYEQGTLTGGNEGCQWSSDGDAAEASQPEDRLTVGAGYEATDVESLVSRWQRAHAVAEPGRCLTVPDSDVDPRAVLQRCAGGEEDWTLFVPTADGAGTWVLTAYIGDHLSAPGAGPALVQVARMASSVWGD